MNRNLKRKRSSSDYKVENSDYENDGKKRKCAVPSSDADNDSVVSSPVPKFNSGSEISSQIFQSDTLDHEEVSSECECETCTHGSSEAGERKLHRRIVLRETDVDLEALESELDESEDYDNLGYSPGSHYDDRIMSSEILSSPMAESIVDSEVEIELLCNEHDDDDEENCDNLEDPVRTLTVEDEAEADHFTKASGKAVTFMGQLTPGSSVGKNRPGTPDCSTWTSFRKLSVYAELYGPETSCPVPQLSWANREKLWEVMCYKDELSLSSRNPDLFEYQQYLKPRMRVILLDWISEVAAVFKLHRETYYLALDYIDRYLSTVENVPKQQLQLIGVTCLVLASKMEEIYPPKIDQFASVTDGACTQEEIFSMEVTVLKHLNWLLSPITINSWLEIMLQFIYQKLEKKNSNLLTPHFSSSLFKKLCQLLDLVTLDITSLRFSYCVLAAAAIYILVDPNLAISSSGLKKEVLEPCVQWMSVYWKVLRETNSSEMASVSELLTDKSEVYFSHQHPELQTHNISMQLYELVQAEFEALEKEKDNPLTLTPPPSSSKSTSTLMSNTDTPC